MATITIHWQASDQLRLAEIAQTGQAQPADRTLTIDLTQVAPAQRTALLALTRIIGERNGEAQLASIRIDSRPKPASAETRARHQYETIPVRLAGEPTLDQAIGLAQEIAGEQAALEAEAERIRAAQRAAEAIVKAADEQARVEIDALQAAGDLAGLRAYQLPATIGEAWTIPARAAYSYLRSAIMTLEDEQRERDRLAWIAAHGSEHLRRCIEAGYNCKRLYVVERAALEAPGFTVDFDDKASWKDRACPTPAALDAEDAARSLGLGEPLIVWLTKPPSTQVPDPEGYDYEEFEPGEAVVLRGYLGKYDLVRMIAG